MKTLVAMATTMSLSLTMGNACYQRNSFSFNRKLANKVDMDEISDEFGTTGQIRSLILELRPYDC